MAKSSDPSSTHSPPRDAYNWFGDAVVGLIILTLITYIYTVVVIARNEVKDAAQLHCPLGHEGEMAGEGGVKSETIEIKKNSNTVAIVLFNPLESGECHSHPATPMAATDSVTNPVIASTESVSDTIGMSSKIVEIERVSDKLSELANVFDSEDQSAKEMDETIGLILTQLEKLTARCDALKEKLIYAKGRLYYVLKKEAKYAKEEEEAKLRPDPGSADECLREIEIINTKLMELGLPSSFLDKFNSLNVDTMDMCDRGVMNKERFESLMRDNMQLVFYLRAYRASESDAALNPSPPEPSAPEAVDVAA